MAVTRILLNLYIMQWTAVIFVLPRGLVCVGRQKSSSISGKNACSVFLFILLFYVNPHFFSQLCRVFHLVCSCLPINFSQFHMLFPLIFHSSFTCQSVVMRFNSPLLAILQCILQGDKNKVKKKREPTHLDL